MRYFTNAAAIVLGLALAAPASAQQIKAGLLTCDVSSGIGLIVTCQNAVSCRIEGEPVADAQTTRRGYLVV
jgi:hypothetical protein